MTVHEAAFGASSPATLRGRVALVTGSSEGLGLAIAEALALAGCSVMLNGLEPADDVADRCTELGGRAGVAVLYRQADLARPGAVEELVGATIAEFGAIDVLVNNAVVRHFAPIVDFPPDRWDAALAVNLTAAFNAIRLSLPGMRQRNYGRIFNMTSVYGLRGTVDRVDYVTTKAALLGLTRSVALENLDFDVTCHSICPGSILTPSTDSRVVRLMGDGLSREQAEHAFLKGKQPGGRFISPNSVTDLLLFLCGPIARDMTGGMLPVEAGWLAS